MTMISNFQSMVQHRVKLQKNMGKAPEPNNELSSCKGKQNTPLQNLMNKLDSITHKSGEEQNAKPWFMG